MNSLKFEMRDYTRPATEEERNEQVINLLATIDSIHTTRSEAKAIASDFKAKVEDLVCREGELRHHLKNNTFIEGVEVHAVVNEMSGNTEYYDKNGTEILELRHPSNKQEKRDEAAKRQTSLFENPEELARQLQDSMNGIDSSITVTVSHYDSAVDAFEAKAPTSTEEAADEPIDYNDLVANEKAADDALLDPAELDSLSVDPQQPVLATTTGNPDIRDGINGFVAIMTGHDRPLPKVNRKKTVRA